jgi:hypothetical protein
MVLPPSSMHYPVKCTPRLFVPKQLPPSWQNECGSVRIRIQGSFATPNREENLYFFAFLKLFKAKKRWISVDFGQLDPQHCLHMWIGTYVCRYLWKIDNKIHKSTVIFEIFFLKPQNWPKFGILDLFSSFRVKIYLVTEVRSRLPNFGQRLFLKKKVLGTQKPSIWWFGSLVLMFMRDFC